MPPGPHHYLVQFVGPIKRQWLRAVKEAGPELRVPFADFTSIGCADHAALEKIGALRLCAGVGHLPHQRRIAPAVLAPPPLRLYITMVPAPVVSPKLASRGATILLSAGLLNQPPV